uniref:Carboxylesterase type B domain-containing protein n=1 Tax=Ditylenchus dipsaci TaxID=166011 RepID=A0A915ECD6_9BILA
MTRTVNSRFNVAQKNAHIQLSPTRPVAEPARAYAARTGLDFEIGLGLGQALKPPSGPVRKSRASLYVPEKVDSTRKLAVLVWVYGGGFWSGSATLDVMTARYSPGTREDVIIVAMNYRV